MKHTYKNATGVIVIDEGCRQLSTKDSSSEIGWSIFASGWFGRLWTYQEGFLPPCVDVELCDGSIDLYKLVQTLYKIYIYRTANPFPAVFVRDLVAVLQKARPLDRYHLERPWERCLVDLFNAMPRRRSSRPDDQILVISLLLDVEIGSLMELDREDRWKDLYMKLGTIPWTVIFDQRPKMQTSCFTWAPSTWISSGKDEWLHYDEELANVTEKGLLVTLTALVFNECAPRNVSCMVIEVEGQLYELSRPNEILEDMLPGFDTLFVRHFKHEQRRSALERNSSLLLRVILGLRNTADGSTILCELHSNWMIRTLGNQQEFLSTDTKVIRGRWETERFCLT